MCSHQFWAVSRFCQKRRKLQEEAPGVLCSRRKLGGRAQELAPFHFGQISLPSHKPPLVSCSENEKENKANENEKSWRWLAAEEDLRPYGVVTGAPLPE